MTIFVEACKEAKEMVLSSEENIEIASHPTLIFPKETDLTKTQTSIEITRICIAILIKIIKVEILIKIQISIVISIKIPILIKDQILIWITVEIGIKIQILIRTQIQVKILKLFAIYVIHQDIHLAIATKKYILVNNHNNKNLINRKTPMPFPERVHKGWLKRTIKCF